MNKNSINKAIQRASQETTRYLSAQLRSEARASGWPSDVSNSLYVSYGKNGFSSHVAKKHYEKAMDLEYGTPDTQPTAALRRLNNRTEQASQFLVNRIFQRIEDEL